jgi:hypothetical protein
MSFTSNYQASYWVQGFLVISGLAIVIVITETDVGGEPKYYQ